MKPKKQKTFSEKIAELKGKSGTIELSDKDRNEFVNGVEDSIEKESREMEKFIWLLVGVGIGIIGNFVVMLFYDWLKGLERWQFVLMSVGLIFLFVVLCYIAIDRILEHKKSIKSLIWSRKMWKRAKSLEIGPAIRAYEEDELEELKKDLAQNKPQETKK